MRFHEILNEYVQNIGITYKALADEAGMTAGVISRYKNGSRLPSVRTGAARKLAEAVASLSVKNGVELSADEVEQRFLEAIAEESSAGAAPVDAQASGRGEGRTASEKAPKTKPQPAARKVPLAKRRAAGKRKTYHRAEGLRKAQIEFYESVLKDPEIKRLFIYQSMPEGLDKNYLTEILSGDVHVFLAVHMPGNPFRLIKAFIEWWPLYRSGRLHLYLAKGGSAPKIFGRGVYYTKKSALTMECMGGDLFYGKAVRIGKGARLSAVKRRMAFVFKLSKRLI